MSTPTPEADSTEPHRGAEADHESVAKKPKPSNWPVPAPDPNVKASEPGETRTENWPVPAPGEDSAQS